ncbi:MAG: CRISPR-associated ring nuclease [Bacteroidales bacterium]|nr:CRISPR-associated ring nuclease [Bacteroidales bacterium]
MNILLSALGAQPDIIEETIGLFNNYNFDFYQNDTYVANLRKQVESVDEVWLVATDQKHQEKPLRLSIYESIDYIKEHCSKYGIVFRFFVLKGVGDILCESDARAYHDLVLRVATYAKQQVTDKGKLYLSLACGRKTMSADMQDAAYCFGCDMLVHVLGDKTEEAQPILLNSFPPNEALKPLMQNFEDNEIIYFEPNENYLIEILRQKSEAQHFFTSYYLNEEETRSNFHILYTLPPSKIEQLKRERIGINKKKESAEIKWLRRLPKTDLHCHLGGVLSPKDMLAVASYVKGYVDGIADENAEFGKWYQHSFYKKSVDIKNIRTYADNLSKKYNVPKCSIVAPLILRFADDPAGLMREIYGDYTEEKNFSGVGIAAYERLGDLQGSSLLDSILSVEATLDVFLKKCIANNVKYVELRCSPLNYAKTAGIPAGIFVLAMCNMLKRAERKIATSLIFIVSRHREDMTKEYVELVNQLKKFDEFTFFFRGFDVAGDESAKSPKEMREAFMDIMKDCHNITIHAGEDQPVDNIWQAVYHLNAERIGHGLTLKDNEDLLNKFLERGIGIEMCPSSNFQIVGFRDNYFPEETACYPTYPLKKYLEKDLIVSVNTDDPGISLTDMTYELHKAARMTEGGLSKWEILQLICNGFRSAFYPYEKKKQLIRNAEKDLGELIKKNWL